MINKLGVKVMAIEKEKFFEVINEVSKSEDLNKDNLLERIGSELKGIKPGAYSTYNNLKIDKLFMIQDSDKTVNCMLLHLAVECNSVPIVKLLLKKKVKVDEQMSGDVNSKFTALHIAALHGHREMIQLLLDNNANPSLKDSQGRTPKDIVGDVEGKKAIIKMLEEGEQHYAEAIATRRQTYRQGTLLQPNNKTPGNLAVGGNNVTAAVQAWGAKHQEENSRITPNNRKIYVQDEDEHTSSNLITNENNINKVDDTLEREQAMRERDAVAKQLKEAEQRLANNQKRIEQTGHNQHSEQYGATYNGEQTFLNKSSSDDSGICFDADESEALSQSRLEDGEDIDAQDENGLTFLHRAAENNNGESVKLLVECGAKVDVQDKDGLTPLHYAATYGYVEIAEYLIDNGAGVDAQDKDGVTPLHYAAAKSAKESVKLLIKRKANVNAQDKDGVTPLSCAVEQNNEELVKLLIKHRADRSLTKDEDLIDRLNKLSEVVSSTSSHSKTNNATEAQGEVEKVKKLRVKLKKSRTQLEDKQKENESLEQKIQELESENATLKGGLGKTKTKTNEVPLEKAQKELEELRNCVTGHETKLEVLEKLNEENESLKQKIKNLENEKDELDKTKTKTNEVSLEKMGKRQFSPKVAYASLAAMLVVGAALSIASGLSALLIVAASVISALIAGGIVYKMSKPTTELKEVNIDPLQHGGCKI